MFGEKLPNLVQYQERKPKIGRADWGKPNPTSLTKNFLIQTKNEGRKPDNFEKEFKWFKEAQSFISHCKEDKNNTIR